MVDLLVLTTLNQVLFVRKLYISFFTKQPILMRRSAVLILLLLLVFPVLRVVFPLAKLSTMKLATATSDYLPWPPWAAQQEHRHLRI